MERWAKGCVTVIACHWPAQGLAAVPTDTEWRLAAVPKLLSPDVCTSSSSDICCNFAGKPTALPGPKTGLPVALEEPDSTAEEKEAAVAEAVTARIEKLESCMHKLTPALNGTHVSDS